MARPIEEIIEYSSIEAHRVEMWNSLQEAIIACGGDNELINKDIKNGMTVFALINLLAQNNIRFTYVG